MIELLISVGVLALITVTAFPFLKSYQTMLDLEDAALSLQNCLISANDYARGPSGGATSYRATLTPAARTCVVQRLAGATPTTVDDYKFAGVDFSNNLQVVQTFSLSFSTGALHDASYATTPSLAPVFGSGTVVWTLTPTGKTTPAKQVTVNLTHGIVTVSP